MKTYMLIGAGGTGSHFIGPALAYLEAYHGNKGEEWQMVVADGDHYEQKNLERQMFSAEHIGINKADAMVRMYNRYPMVSVPAFLGKDDLERMMQNGDTIFIGVDNYSLRALVEERALALQDIAVINAGNEVHSGSVQLFVRAGGKNKTPRLSKYHREIAFLAADDRSAMTCAQAAALPGGEQLIIANMAAAQHMLTGLWRLHSGDWETGWTELQFDLKAGIVEHIDMRIRKNWAE